MSAPGRPAQGPAMLAVSHFAQVRTCPAGWRLRVSGRGGGILCGSRLACRRAAAANGLACSGRRALPPAARCRPPPASIAREPESAHPDPDRHPLLLAADRLISCSASRRMSAVFSTCAPSIWAARSGFVLIALPAPGACLHISSNHPPHLLRAGTRLPAAVPD